MRTLEGLFTSFNISEFKGENRGQNQQIIQENFPERFPDGKSWPRGEDRPGLQAGGGTGDGRDHRPTAAVRKAPVDPSQVSSGKGTYISGLTTYVQY